MPVTERTYQMVALEDPEGQWELHRDRLREKPAMTASHNQAGVDLAFSILQQVDRREYTVRVNSGRTKRADETYYIPDVFVVPNRLVAPQFGRTDMLEVYEAPLLFVGEIWSLSTGNYNVDRKIPEYKRRGALEIWRLPPYERTVIAWRRHPDGSYDETIFRGGVVRLHALPEVSIDLDELFALS